MKRPRSSDAEGPIPCGYDALVEVLLAKIEQQAQPKSVLAYLRARRYIEEHYLTLRTVEEVAKACKLNRMYLSRLFRRFARTGVYQFMTWLKMKRAAVLLCGEGMTVKEVAEKQVEEFTHAFGHEGWRKAKSNSA